MTNQPTAAEPTVEIPMETAAHVLWQDRLGGWPPSTFATKLLSLWTSADTDNADRLAVAFPDYAAAIALVKSGQDGIQQLRVMAGDDTAEACGKCEQPFDPADTRHDGRAQHAGTPYCRGCVDRCHESTDAFHVCVICRDPR
ncbi:hypothetical protein [Streptomyces sp. NPDC003730]